MKPSIILFFLAFGIFLFTRLSKLVPTIPIAILISFILILRFSRSIPAKRSYLVFIGFMLSMNIGLWGLFDIGSGSLVFNLIRSSLLALLYYLPFMADRLLYPKFSDKWYSTLVFPTITTAIFYLLTIEGPFEGIIQPAKFAFGATIFRQFLSLFGTLGFVYLTSWLASASNDIWEKGFKWKKTRNTVIALSTVIIAVMLFGAVKIYASPVNETVKVASILIDPAWGDMPTEEVFYSRTTTPYETIQEIEAKVQTASGNGAKIATFMEFSMIIDEKDNQRLRDDIARIARENDIYIAFSYAYYADKGENKHLLFDSNGEILIDYSKKYLLGIGDVGETAVFRKGPEILQFADTPYGRITLSVCREMEMEKYLIQAARARADIMITSAYEWPKAWIPNNIQMPVVNGFSMVRTTYNGVSHAQDYNGRILNQMYFEDGDIMYSEVPTRGVRTLFSYVGKAIGWLSVIHLLVLISLLLFNKRFKR